MTKPAGDLSIIIPALNEAGVIGETLGRLRAQLGKTAEILVVDGGSADGTQALAHPLARVIEGPRGRAAQLNRGAGEASGQWLLFLHADTRLPEGFPGEPAAAARAGCRAGAFRLRIAGRHPLLPLLSAGANARTRLRGIFLGDQAPFLERELFTEMGGFPDQPLLEDLELALRLKRRGVRVYLSPLAAETSGRRWEQEGFFATWWRMRRIFQAYRRGGSAALPGLGYPDVR